MKLSIRKNFIPGVEALEDRCVPTAYLWVGGGANAWDNANNWNPNNINHPLQGWGCGWYRGGDKVR